MQIFNNIKELLKKHKITMENCAKEIEMSKVGFSRTITRQTLSVVNLIRIAKLLNEPISAFFGDDYNRVYDQKLNDNIVHDKDSIYKKTVNLEERLNKIEAQLKELNKELQEKNTIINGFMNGKIKLVGK